MKRLFVPLFMLGGTVVFIIFWTLIGVMLSALFSSAVKAETWLDINLGSIHSHSWYVEQGVKAKAVARKSQAKTSINNDANSHNDNSREWNNENSHNNHHNTDDSTSVTVVNNVQPPAPVQEYTPLVIVVQPAAPSAQEQGGVLEKTQNTESEVVESGRKRYNEENFGLGITTDINDFVTATAGFYQNSYDELSWYVGVTPHTELYAEGKTKVELGALVAVATGYEDYTGEEATPFLIPNVTLKHGSFKFTVGHMPGEVAVTTFQAGIRF